MCSSESNALPDSSLGRGLYVSAPWRSSGKTIFSIGLARLAKRRNLHVQPFKKGPDYIDPLWLSAAGGHAALNIDPFVQSTQEWQALWSSAKEQADFSFVEGTMGLHDGVAEDGSDCNATIARQLNTPVVLVMDCRGIHRGVAALVDGLMRFDIGVEFHGVVLNCIRSERHAGKIRRALEEYTDIDVLGSLPELSGLNIDERELGLVPAVDHPAVEAIIDESADQITAGCDIDKLLPEPCEHHRQRKLGVTRVHPSKTRYRVGIARDQAFHFYYNDDLDALRQRGTELVEFSPLRDDTLPPALDALLIGGGFPERHLAALSANSVMRGQIKTAIENGLVVHAECAGLMYLCRGIDTVDGHWPMAGVIDASVSLQPKAVGRGYMKLESATMASATYPAHEFHHSTLAFASSPHFAYRVTRGYGVDGISDGIVIHNVIATYAHFRHCQATPWVDWLLSRVERARAELKNICSR